jgi:hypothetical protein
MFAQFNFDMLKALVEEMNRYDESARDALRMLNAKPEYSADSEFMIEVREKGELLNPAWINPKVWEGNPLSFDKMYIHIERPSKSSATPSSDTDAPALACNDDDDDDGYTQLRIAGNDLVAMFPQDGRFVFKQGDYEINLTRVKKSTFSHWDAF